MKFNIKKLKVGQPIYYWDSRSCDVKYTTIKSIMKDLATGHVWVELQESISPISFLKRFEATVFSAMLGGTFYLTNDELLKKFGHEIAYKNVINRIVRLEDRVEKLEKHCPESLTPTATTTSYSNVSFTVSQNDINDMKAEIEEIKAEVKKTKKNGKKKEK